VPPCWRARAALPPVSYAYGQPPDLRGPLRGEEGRGIKRTELGGRRREGK